MKAPLVSLALATLFACSDSDSTTQPMPIVPEDGGGVVVTDGGVVGGGDGATTTPTIDAAPGIPGTDAALGEPPPPDAGVTEPPPPDAGVAEPDAGPPPRCTSEPRLFAYVDAAEIEGDGEQLYIVDRGTQALSVVPLEGGAVEPFAFDPNYNPFRVHVEGGYVYWMAGDIEVGETVAISRRRADGSGDITRVADYSWGGGMDVEGDWVYVSFDQDTGIGRFPAAGGTFQDINRDAGGDGTALVADGSHVYYVEGNAVKRLPIAGGEPEMVASLDPDPRDGWAGYRGADAGDRVLFVINLRSFEPGFSRVISVPKSGGAVTVIDDADGAFRRLHVHGGRVVFGDGNQVAIAPVGGGAVRPLATASETVRDVYTDGTCVYYNITNQIWIVAD